MPYLVILSAAKYPQNQNMDSSPAAQNDKTLPLPCAFSFDEKRQALGVACLCALLLRSLFVACLFCLVILSVSEKSIDKVWILRLRLRMTKPCLCRAPFLLMKRRQLAFGVSLFGRLGFLARLLRAAFDNPPPTPSAREGALRGVAFF